MTEKQRWHTALAGLGALVLGLSSACAMAAGVDHEQPIGDALLTGPLVAPNPTALPKGHWNVEPYLLDSIAYGSYDNNWDHMNTDNAHAFRSVTLLEYGLTDRLSVALLPQFGYNLVEHGPDSNGLRLGDTTLRGHFMLTEFHKGSWMPTTAIALSQTLPSGKYDGLGDNPSNGLGSGIWTTKVGLWTQGYFWMPNGRILRARLALSYAMPDNHASVTGVSVYGTPRSFNGSIDTGNTFAADMSFEYSMTRHWVPVIEVVYSHTDGGRVAGTIASQSASGILLNPAVTTDTKASESFEVAPAVEYSWNQHYGLIVGAEVTVAGRNTGSVVTPQAALNIYY